MDCRSLKVKLPSGNLMPLIGFGTFQIRGGDLIKSVLDYALSAGYRHIDTAAVYGNEVDIGRALKVLLPKYKLTREDIFITSKLSPSDHGNKAVDALEKSVRNIDCKYLDLYLIHWPGVSGAPVHSPDNAKLRTTSWQYLIQGVRKGLVKDIGVSNYTIKHLSELLGSGFDVRPAVNQVEWHPQCHQNDLKEFCEKEKIVLQAYSSLGGSNNKKLIDDSVVVEISKKLKKTPAQILLKWSLQQNISIIPKGRSKEHIENNIDLNFVIPEGDMKQLSNLEKDEKYAWDPRKIA